MSKNIVVFLLILQSTYSIPVVVIDPGHGGKKILPSSVYGDKYNPLTGKYEISFRQGAQFKGVYEHQEVFIMAKQIQKLLNLTLKQETHQQFLRILNKYSRYNYKKVKPIQVFLSRKKSHHLLYKQIKDDINAPYRLYDYPDIHTSRLKRGRISKINLYKPSLVVALHFTNGKKNKKGAMGSVITPSYFTYKKAIDYVKHRSKREQILKEFELSPYKDWFKSTGRNKFESFLTDAWIYFTGSWPTQDGLSLWEEKKHLPRYNLVTWKYQDSFNTWSQQVHKKTPYSPYSFHLKNITLNNAYWEREKDLPEKWKREQGYEGYGGDNFYASEELLRFVRKGLYINKINAKKQLPEILPPYISTWSLPSYVNAICAFLELGHLDIEKDRNRVLKNGYTYSESIAVGIYSLFYGLKQHITNYKYNFPKGKAIDFRRYETYKDKNYFKQSI